MSFLGATVLRWQIHRWRIPKNDNSVYSSDQTTKNGLHHKATSSCGQVKFSCIGKVQCFIRKVREERQQYLGGMVKFGSKEKVWYISSISWLQFSDWYPTDLSGSAWLFCYDCSCYINHFFYSNSYFCTRFFLQTILKYLNISWYVTLYHIITKFSNFLIRSVCIVF